MHLNLMQFISKNRVFLLLLVCYIVISGILIFRIPAFSGPNEALHYEYIALMRLTGRLPELGASQRADERHQPPVYYTTATLLSLPFDEPSLDTDFIKNPFFTATYRGNLNPFIHVSPGNAPLLYLSRFVSMLFGIAALVSIYIGARLSLTLPISLLMVSITAFHPTFLHLSATVNNDLAVTAVCATLIAYTTYLIQANKRPFAFFYWGILFAMALLTKASAVFLFLLLPITCWTIGRSQQQLSRAIRSGFWGIIGFAPFWLSWLVFNQIRSQDALGLASSIPVSHMFSVRPVDFILLVPYAGELFRSFWLDWSPGILGYAPLWVYIIWGFLLLVALTGWFRRKNTVPQPISILRLHLFWVISLSGAFFAVKALMIRDVGFLVPEGRWLLPVLPSIAWMVGIGWARWWPIDKQLRACHIATTIPLISAFILLISFFPILYPKAQRLASVNQIPNRSESVNLIYDQQLELLATEAEPVIIGKPAKITLYWFAREPISTDYAVSVQLLHSQAGEWIRLAGQDSFPGSGLNPTLGWQEGEIYRDQIILQPEGELNGPTSTLLLVSLANGQNQVSIEQNGLSTDWPIASEMVARPSSLLQVPAGIDHPNSAVNFGGLFELLGLTYALEDGEFVITLWWKALDDIPNDFTVFIHMLDSNGQLIDQSDTIPAAGSSPTRFWQAGDIIRDQHRFESRPSSGSILSIGAYDSTTLIRLHAAQDGQLLPDNVWQMSVP